MEGLPDTGLDTSSWTTGTLPPIADVVDINDLQIAAKNTLAAADYAYYRTAALDEVTYQANLFIWEKIRLNGYSFVDVSNSNLKTSILGYEFNAPFFIAPAAQAGRASSGAETNLVQAAGAAGILYVPSISSTQSIATIGAAAVSRQVMFHQEYIWSDQTRLQTELQEMEAAGFKAIFLTVDNTGVNGIRDRQMRFSAGGDAGHSATFTIDALNQLRNMTTLPIVPKGVKTARDVKLCADLGFPAVYISNHGGRVVDMAPTAVEVLLDVHRLYPEVFDQIEIYADGGVRRATHVLTLLALGARAVGLGRPFMFSNVYGEAGVTKAIDILTLELTTTMALMGQADVDEFRGNTSFINTHQVELEYYGAPLSIDTSSDPTSIKLVSSVGSTSTSRTTTSSSVSSVSSSATSSSATVSISSASSSSATHSTSSVSASPSSASSTLATSATSQTPSSSASSSTAAAAVNTATVSCPGSNSTTYTTNGLNFLIECGIDHSGGDLSSKSVSSFSACINACATTAGCVDVSLSGSACYLKQSVGQNVYNGVFGARLIA
ncbi:hypothetical protein LTR85_003753 [Meristemomyces frigidus]|nr:hypothetical protein LTR85_003753 [Meristemomyces frigidus]